jgi:putative membrane protein
MNTSKISIALAASLFGLSAFAQNGPTDPQIAGIVVTANKIDVDAGKLAGALAKKLKVKPADSDTSKSLKAGAAENLKNLKALKGAAFDKAYVDHEVAYHQQVLDAIDQVLIPNAKNAELKDLIVKVRPAIAAHLDHAKMIQADLAKK